MSGDDALLYAVKNILHSIKHNTCEEEYNTISLTIHPAGPIDVVKLYTRLDYYLPLNISIININLTPCKHLYFWCCFREKFFHLEVVYRVQKLTTLRKAYSIPHIIR